MNHLRQTLANFIARRVSPNFADALNAQARFIKDPSGSAVVVDITYDLNSMLVGIFGSSAWRFNTGSTLVITH
jgi:hypothetical protein